MLLNKSFKNLSDQYLDYWNFVDDFANFYIILEVTYALDKFFLLLRGGIFLCQLLEVEFCCDKIAAGWLMAFFQSTIEESLEKTFIAISYPQNFDFLLVYLKLSYNFGKVPDLKSACILTFFLERSFSDHLIIFYAGRLKMEYFLYKLRILHLELKLIFYLFH